MKKRHNKKRNIAFVYEALVREATVAVLRKDGERKNKTDNSKLGLWNNLVGKYGVSDIELVGAYDINKNKINSDVSETIFTLPNQLEEFVKLKNCGIVVEKGILEDDVNPNLKSSIDISANSTEAFKKLLLEKKNLM